MTSIFIPSMMGDTDSLLVKVSLELNGHAVTRLVGDNYPASQVSSFRVSNSAGISGSVKDKGSELFYDHVDVVWLRRPRWPVLPNYVHEQDAKIADQDCRSYIRDLFQAAWHKAYWVNSLVGRRKANSKLLQLQEAVRIGIPVPATLISNDPTEVKTFIELNRDEVIVKGLGGGDWLEDGVRHVTFTSAVSIDRLPDDRFIQVCPCIYQRRINKQYEVRLIFFGAEAIAIRLDSQKEEETRMDWRVGASKNLDLKQIEVPEQTYVQCRQLMQALGIVHGSFDFAVDLDNNWVFFEVNEAGQFLWIEGKNPEVPLLDIATQFLAAPSWEFKFGSPISQRGIYDIAELSRYKELVIEDKENYFSTERTAII